LRRSGAGHPLVELVLAEGTSEAVAEWVESGRVELGIVQLPASGGSFTEHPLLTEPFVLLASSRGGLARRRSVRLESLATEPFVFYKGRARETALAACRAAGFEPRVACESGELETVRALVAAGLGVALLPRLAAREPGASCVAIRISAPRIERHLAVLTRAGHTLSPAAEVFRKLLRPGR